ncbi:MULTISPECIES: hypothetical protein [unclassified Gilliamella]|uniref:hypothetical protein n=1 Tax=unclassified Gilliamella TaxID=2685620 RepID=UPI00130C1140|nr:MULTISPECIES: hypothetical protein [unclassified Gilliamella]MWP48245.1 hypothetical protein [Gilliamella sp. Lep-s35]MWP68165.1 hypothetical protein [Gilliamella sp. Lep-s5]MWP76385.1 hypothetical protein [Gilliamella sp. Lep-s21]
MKISNILICAIVSILVASCANKISSTKNKETISQADQISLLRQQTEVNNPYIVDAKNKLIQFVGSKNFDNYVTKRGILNCQGDKNQSSCVLSFYLNEYHKLKYDMQLKKAVELNQAEHDIELSKIKATESNIKNYCQSSADFIAAIYTKDTDKITQYFQPKFKMSAQDILSLQTKITKDNYSLFLIEENPSILQEIKIDYVEECLNNPKDNIINYSNIFR